MDYQKIIGLILLCSIFISSSFGKLINPVSTYNGIVSKGLPLPLLATIFAIGSQLLGLFLIFSVEFNIFKLNSENNNILKNIGKYLLIIFTVLATYYYHNMFTDSKQKYHFMKNIAIIGGLMLI